MTTDSRRDDDTQEVALPGTVHLMLGYDLADSDIYENITIMRLRDDGVIEVLDALKTKATRAGLLFFACTVIKTYKPTSFSVVPMVGEPIRVSTQTVREIANGTKTWRDLSISSNNQIRVRGE